MTDTPTIGVLAEVVAERRYLVESLGQGAEGADDELDDDKCWPWKSGCDRDGYGLKTYQGRQWRVHRLAFMLANGEDPGDSDVLHRCDNPPCFRPSHLYAGTNLDNVRDKVERGRARNQYTDADVCIYGHPFDAENTYVNPASGSRQCCACRRRSNALDKRLAKYPKSTARVLREIFRERARQDFVFDEQNHPDGTGPDARPLRAIGQQLLGYSMAVRAQKLAGAARRACQDPEQPDTWTAILLVCRSPPSPWPGSRRSTAARRRRRSTPTVLPSLLLLTLRPTEGEPMADLQPPEGLREKIADAIPYSLISTPAVGIGGARRLKLAKVMLAALADAGWTLLPPGVEVSTQWSVGEIFHDDVEVCDDEESARRRAGRLLPVLRRQAYVGPWEVVPDNSEKGAGDG